MITYWLWELSFFSTQKMDLLLCWPALGLLGHCRKLILSQTQNTPVFIYDLEPVFLNLWAITPHIIEEFSLSQDKARLVIKGIFSCCNFDCG